jgi:hypothetical protein
MLMFIWIIFFVYYMFPSAYKWLMLGCDIYLNKSHLCQISLFVSPNQS